MEQHDGDVSGVLSYPMTQQFIVESPNAEERFNTLVDSVFRDNENYRQCNWMKILGLSVYSLHMANQYLNSKILQDL